MDYEILSALSTYDLRAKVRLAIEEGWQPLGGLCYGRDNFYQTMTRFSAPWGLTTTTITGDTGASATLQQINERMLAR